MSRSVSSNPYAALGVMRSSSDADIRTAYYRAMREAHPDRGGSHENATRINAVYALICSKTQRDKHSQGLELLGKTLCSTCEGRGGIFKRVRKHRALVICESCEGLGYV